MAEEMNMTIGNTLLKMVQTVMTCMSATEIDGSAHGTDYYTTLPEIQDFYNALFPLRMIKKSIPSFLKSVKAVLCTPSTTRSTDSMDSTISISGTSALSPIPRADVEDYNKSTPVTLNIEIPIEKQVMSQQTSCTIPSHIRSLKDKKYYIQE